MRLIARRSKYDLICSALTEQDHPGVDEVRLYPFYVHLGNQSYTAIEELVSNRNSQSKQDSGKNVPINRIGGVIFSELNDPITPNDRNGNRYMIKFIDYKTNYCRVF